MPSGAVSLVEGQSLPHALVLDDERLYWVTEGEGARGIWSLPKVGGAPTQLVGLPDPNVENPDQVVIGIAIDTDNVYWTQANGDGSCTMGDPEYRQDQALSVPKGGGDPDVLWETCPGRYPHGIAVDGQYAFISVVNQHRVERVRLGTLNIETLSGEQYDPLQVTMDQTHVYWIARTDNAGGEGRILRAPKQAKDVIPTMLFEVVGDMDRRPNAMAVDEESVYWVDTGRVMALDKADPGETTRELASDVGSLAAIAIDEGYVYWTNATEGRILRVAKGGGEVEVLAVEQGDPEAIAVDGEAVYWTNFVRGDVVRLEKPKGP